MKKNFNSTLSIIALLGLGFLFLLPFFWMVSTSLKPLNETMKLPPQWLPSSPQWHNYPDAMKAMGPFWLYARNSLVLAFLNVVGTVFSSALVAYGFSRLDWRGRDGVFFVLLATMMIPFPVVMVPIYGLFARLDRDLPALMGTRFSGWSFQCVSSSPILSHDSKRPLGSRTDRWM